MSRWLSPWSLREAPFSKENGDADLWIPGSRASAVERLVETCHGHGHALLVGEPGVGKTCVLRALRHRLPQDGFRLTYCHNVTLGRRDFYRHICLALGLAPSATAAAVFYAISTHVSELGTDNVHPVMLIDEAHLLHQDVLSIYISWRTTNGTSKRCCRSSWSACPRRDSVLDSRRTARCGRGSTRDCL